MCFRETYAFPATGAYKARRAIGPCFHGVSLNCLVVAFAQNYLNTPGIAGTETVTLVVVARGFGEAVVVVVAVVGQRHFGASFCCKGMAANAMSRRRGC